MPLRVKVEGERVALGGRDHVGAEAEAVLADVDADRLGRGGGDEGGGGEDGVDAHCNVVRSSNWVWKRFGKEDRRQRDINWFGV